MKTRSSTAATRGRVFVREGGGGGREESFRFNVFGRFDSIRFDSELKMQRLIIWQNRCLLFAPTFHAILEIRVTLRIVCSAQSEITLLSFSHAASLAFAAVRRLYVVGAINRSNVSTWAPRGQRPLGKENGPFRSEPCGFASKSESTLDCRVSTVDEPTIVWHGNGLMACFVRALELDRRLRTTRSDAHFSSSLRAAGESREHFQGTRINGIVDETIRRGGFYNQSHSTAE